ncbi:hypothetical protein [Microbacterium sp. K36]|uniref:hypothetical protein n=1 Tax=Microbacterium sp. K36 TaxID=2305439 RepID=UPI00109CBED9|nr:hypothetical protein [Microbacterium sp. K36]
MSVLSRAYFIPHEPVGSRCYGALLADGGAVLHEWDYVEAARSEIGDLHANNLDPALTEAEQKEYASQLMLLMHKAKTGQVRFVGRDAEGNIVGRTLVELKPRLPQVRAAFGRRPRLLRLYLGEPAIHPRKLLALRLATKEDSAAGLDEQDADIAEAKARAEAWCSGTA